MLQRKSTSHWKPTMSKPQLMGTPLPHPYKAGVPDMHEGTNNSESQTSYKLSWREAQFSGRKLLLSPCASCHMLTNNTCEFLTTGMFDRDGTSFAQPLTFYPNKNVSHLQYTHHQSVLLLFMGVPLPCPLLCQWASPPSPLFCLRVCSNHILNDRITFASL